MSHTNVRFASLISLYLLSLAIGCTDSGGGGAPPGGEGELAINPPKIFTGFDGTNTYKAPVVSTPASGAEWSIGDPSLADIAPDGDGTQLMITTKKAGTTTITVKAGGQTATAELIIAAYTTEQHDVGERRYMEGGGGDPGCITCHANGPDHTPTQVDADTDEQVINSFVNGVDPEGVPIPTPKHMWSVTEEEKPGLVSYLRSLEPAGYPEPDQPTPGN